MKDEKTTIAAPIAESSRIKTIDMLRGIALLGILLMNIPSFAMPDYSFEAFKNDPKSINFWVYTLITIVFEGKMRAMFSIIFGAGVLLFIANKGGIGKSLTPLFYRRMFWLVLFGLLHAHLLLWSGDILYLYGICGMFLYLVRNTSPKYLIWVIPFVAIVDFTVGTLQYQDIRENRIAYTEAVKAQNEKKNLTSTQTKALVSWREIEKSMIPNREDAKENTAKMKSNYSTVASYMRPMSFGYQTKYLPYELWDILALMILGLVLYKWGFLNGNWSNENYWKVVKIGYGIGLPLVIYSFYYKFVHFTTMESFLLFMEKTPIKWNGLIYPFQRILLSMAHLAAFILLYKSGFAQNLFRRLTAVGQMAFTNYIMHTIICSLFFYGYGLNYYGELEYYQIYYLVFAIWIFQLIMSPIWLKYFLFGPLEWLWRSLTYWKIQPLKRTSVR